LRRRNLWIYAFLLPTFVLYGMYTLYPVVASYWYSLVEWNGFTADQSFVGLENYRAVLADPMFWSAVRITLVFMLIVAPLRVFGAFALAIALNSPKLPFTGFFRTVYFLPVVTTTAIVGVVMRFILDPASGPLSLLSELLGQGPIDLLGSTGTALPTAAIIYVWKFFGITLIYWMAALQTIPKDLYEAARIDGAGGWKVFRHITLPLLVPFLLIISILTVEDCFHAPAARPPSSTPGYPTACPQPGRVRLEYSASSTPKAFACTRTRRNLRRTTSGPREQTRARSRGPRPHPLTCPSAPGTRSSPRDPSRRGLAVSACPPRRSRNRPRRSWPRVRDSPSSAA
jgi:ABC-type sugar transport system permease subunit